jgi:hypothetical protein
MVNCRPHLRIVQTLTHATQLHRTSTLCRDGQRPQNRVNPIHKCIRINVGAAPVAQLDRMATLEVGILNQISVAFGVAYTETRCATTLLNWTEAGPKPELKSKSGEPARSRFPSCHTSRKRLPCLENLIADFWLTSNTVPIVRPSRLIAT